MSISVSQYFPITDPTWIFFIVLSIILLAPMVLERLRVPSIVGMILAGIAIGPHGGEVLNRDASFELFGKVGLYYIMFLASLEMNLQDVEKIRWKALVFGLLTFAIPIVVGTAANLWILGTAAATAVLMGAMYASHTLLPYPIVLRYGVAQRLSVNLAVGSTIVADTLTLLVLAVVGGIFKEHTTGMYWVWLVVKIILIGAFIIYAFPRVSRWFFRRVNDGVVQYIFVLGMVFLGAGLMEIVGMEGILGAFLVGFVLNKQIPATSPLMNHIEFIGNALFIPYFLIGVGMLIDVSALMDLRAVEVAVVMIVVSIGTKWAAAFAAQRLYGLSKLDRRLMFGLTTARAAATLAIVLVGYRIMMPNGERLFGEEVLNGTMILILVTCICSSFTTESASRLLAASSPTVGQKTHTEDRLVIALSNPDTVDPLVNLALMLRRPKSALPLSAVNIVLEGNEERQRQGRKDLERAAHIAAAANVRMLTHSRWSVNVVSGLTHAMKELDASDLIIGLHQRARIFETFFGQLSTDLVSSVDRQIIVYRSFMPINTVRRIHLVVPKKAEYEPYFGLWAERIARLSAQLSCTVEVYSGEITLNAVEEYWKKNRLNVAAQYHVYHSWKDYLPLAHNVKTDHLVCFVLARQGNISRHNYMEQLATQLERYFSSRNLMLIYPARYRGTYGNTNVLVAK